VKRCRHCQIPFITHPRNAGRNDLRCPFGCRQAHRKKQSIKRSTEYYRSSAGKIKKKAINDRRKKTNCSHLQIESTDDCPIDWTALGHIQVLTSMIEGRWISLKDILAMVRNLLRQHSIDFGPKTHYMWAYLSKQPP
jgi:hypothetical protein